MSVKRQKLHFGGGSKGSKARKFAFRIRIFPAEMRLKSAVGGGSTSDETYTLSTNHWRYKSIFRLLTSKIMIQDWRANYVVKKWDEDEVNLDLNVESYCEMERLTPGGNSFVIVPMTNWKMIVPNAEWRHLLPGARLPQLWNTAHVIQIFIDRTGISDGGVPLDDITFQGIQDTIARFNNTFHGHLHFGVVENIEHVISQAFIGVIGAAEGRSNSRVGMHHGNNCIHIVTGRPIRAAERSFAHELLHVMGMFHLQQYPYIHPFINVDFRRVADVELADYGIVLPQFFHQAHHFRVCSCSIMLYSANHGGERVITWTGRPDFEDFGGAHYPCVHDIKYMKHIYPRQQVDLRLIVGNHSHRHLAI